MTIIIFWREPFLGAAVCLALLGVLPIASQLGADGCPQAWGWVHPALTSAWWGSPFHGCLALPCLTLYLSYSQLCFPILSSFSSPPLCSLSFSLRDSALLRLCRWRGLCMLKLMLIYLLLFLYAFWAHTKVESITPILNPNHTCVWLRRTVLERTSQNGEFTVMGSQVSSLSVWNVCAFFLILRHFLLASHHWCLLCFSLFVAPLSSFLPLLHVP